MCTYLQARGRSYNFRRVIPVELRPFLEGRQEITRALGTKDRTEAKRLIAPITIETDSLFASARKRLEAGERPGHLSGEAGGRAPSEKDIEQMEWQARDDARRESRREQLEPLIEFLEGRLKGSTQKMPRALRAFKHILDDVLGDRETIRGQLQAARHELLEARQAQVDPIKQPVMFPTESGATMPLLPMFDAYAKAQIATAGVAKEWRVCMERLVAFLGHDDAAVLTAEDVMSWRDALLAERIKGGKLRAPVTVKGRYIGALKAMLGWAVEERKLAVNVAAQVVVRVPKRAKLREREFTADEARAILTASLLPVANGMAAENALARRWIPWLCAYTGARVNELSQLRGEDIRRVDGIWTVRITPEAGTVKAKVARIVPLHPHLIEQGFPTIAEANGDGPLFYDPSRQRVQSDDNRHFKKVGEKLGQWVRSGVGIKDPNVQPNHGWRHLFKSLAMAAEMPERIADVIQGHAPKSVGRSYGSVPLKTMADAIAKLPRFEVNMVPVGDGTQGTA